MALSRELVKALKENAQEITEAATSHNLDTFNLADELAMELAKAIRETHPEADTESGALVIMTTLSAMKESLLSHLRDASAGNSSAVTGIASFSIMLVMLANHLLEDNTKEA